MKNKIHGNVKCDCGHTKKDHYQGGWFHPNVEYIKKKKNEKRELKNIIVNRNTSVR